MYLIFEGRNRVTQSYGGAHTGIDIVGDDSRDVLAASSGEVCLVQQWDGATKKGMQSYGNLVVVQDKAGRRCYYAHLREANVHPGQQVKTGDKLGVMGNTGNSFGAHTHFELRAADNRTNLDPAAYLGIPNLRGTYIRTPPKLGWQIEGGSWRYYDDGELARSRWVKHNGFWYWLDEDGWMATGMQRIDGKLYCLNPAEGEGIPVGACVITDANGAIA